jgi:hypothetical protein
MHCFLKFVPAGSNKNIKEALDNSSNGTAHFEKCKQYFEY